MVTFTVVLDTPKGRAILDVPTFQGPDAAGRRALFTACSMGWGDVDTVEIVSVTQTA